MILFKYSESVLRDSLGFQEGIAKLLNKSNNINKEENGISKK